MANHYQPIIHLLDIIVKKLEKRQLKLLHEAKNHKNKSVQAEVRGLARAKEMIRVYMNKLDSI